MERKFSIKVECNLDLTNPFDYGNVKEALAEKFINESESRCTGLYIVPYAWDFRETTNPDDIVHEITCEITEQADKFGASEQDVLFWRRHGDNGKDDIGYEIRWISRPQVLFDIYIKKDKGIWTIYLDRNGQGKDLPISCIEDLIEYHRNVSN